MTSLVEEMVEERYGSIKVKKRMQALANMKAFASGPGRGLLVGKSVQSIKADMDV
jgi:hypothetical protein